eukprot:gene7747-12217_t
MTTACIRCTKKVYQNELVRSNGYDFHERCFKCMNCNKKLVLGKTCDVSVPGSNEKKVYCQACYNSQVGPKTLGFGSSGAGGGLDVTSGSQKPSEFKPTVSQTSTIKKTETKPTTTTSYQSSGGSSSNKCIACGKTAYMNEQVKAHNYVFHDKCFKCMNCKAKLTLGKSCDTKDHKVICQVCYNSIQGPKTLGFVSGGGGSGLDVAKKSEGTSSSSSSGDDEFAQLEKLASLKAKGIITEEEFTAKKKQILGL